jgi:hypothetical protein
VAKKVLKSGLVALAIILVFVLGLVLLSSADIGMTRIISGDSLLTPDYDISNVPQSVVDEAVNFAGELLGNYQVEHDEFVAQLLAVYSETNDKDLVVIINPGGWGSKTLKTSDGWWSILSGIEAKLTDLGYNTLWLYHIRTEITLLDYLKEVGEMMVGYTSKARDLATRVEFLTSNIPGLKVIIVAESNGTVITDKVMGILRDNPRVFSIQTGPPYWLKRVMWDRTLVMNDNGIDPDSLTQGNLLAMAWGNLRKWLHLAQPVTDYGTPPHIVGAPGHDYWWQYPKVYSQITEFLEENLGTK